MDSDLPTNFDMRAWWDSLGIHSHLRSKTVIDICDGCIYIYIYIHILFGFPIAGMDDHKLINQVDHVLIAQAPANGAGPTATSATERNRSLQQLSRWVRPSIFFRFLVLNTSIATWVEPQ